MSIPDFIKETSSKIRHAVIGGEITNTIADGIEKIAGVAQDSTDTTKEIEEYIKAVELEWDSDPNKDPEVLEARGGQPRLKDRFENTDRQLAQTTRQTQDYIDLQLKQLNGLNLKGAFATLSELQNAYPDGEEGIFVVQENGSWYYWNGEQWESGGEYQAMPWDEFMTIQDEEWVI